MKRHLPLLIAGLLLAGCGQAAPATPQPPTAQGFPPGGALRTQGDNGPCRPAPAFATDLKVAAAAHLPVPTTVTATTRMGDRTEPQTIAQALGVKLDPAAIEAAAQANGWEFKAGSGAVVLSVRQSNLQGAALQRAQSYGPAWPGGAALYQVTFPRGSLGSGPDLGAYARQLAASADQGQASLVIVTAGEPKPGPSSYRFYWGPFDLGKFAQDFPGSQYDLCGAWQGSQLMAYENGRIAPQSVSLVDIGNGGKLGFGAGRFVTESLHAGTDLVTWYAVPGLVQPVNTR